MESRTAVRASSDAVTAVAVYSVAGTWLAAVAWPDIGLQAVGVGAGALVIGNAAASVLRRTPCFSTPADRVTLLRAILVAVCAVLAVPVLLTGARPGTLLVIVGAAAFLLDAVDGPVARRTGTASALGARLDTATDAALVLVLSCGTAVTVGAWTLCIGGLYYFFVAAGRFWPHLRSPLPSRAGSKTIGAFQPFALLIALIPDIPPGVGVLATGLALPLLVFSFGRDVVELERRRRIPVSV
jgi:phosphatidylglycerophosphate synthase